MLWKSVRIEIQECLGEGSQGRVFKALRVDPSSGLTQTVAIKILHSKTAVELWQKEFESLQRVRSPYCVQVLSFERLRGRPALLLEFVDGISLAELGRTCLLESADIEEILAQIQLGLSDLHARGIAHGDLSPHNVLIDNRGRVRLLDFGLANGSGAQARVTPQFAAPERLQGAAATFTSDLFSLGRLEQFLGATPPTDNTYLHSHPQERKARAIAPLVRRQLQLAVKLESLRERRQLAAAATTHASAAPAPPSSNSTRPKALLLAGLASVLCVASPRASQATRAPAGVLAVHTNSWHHLSIDGVPAGYAPLTMELRAGHEHRLSWVSAQGRGQRILRLRPGEILTLGDRDFSH